MLRADRARRDGFTIIELLVATALILMIMAIISTAFRAGLDTFRQLKAIGDLQEQLRSAGIILKRDLGAPHFEQVGSEVDTLGPYLRDQSLELLNGRPPERGFFRIFQGSFIPPTAPHALPPPPFPTYYREGRDADGLESYVATDQFLQFTVRLRGDRPQNLFSTFAPSLATLSPPDFRDGSSFYSPWVVVTYTLMRDPNPAEWQYADAARQVPLFALVRVQHVSPGVPVPPSNNPFPPGVSQRQATGGNPPGQYYTTSPADLTIPEFRPSTVPSSGTGEEIVLTNVISFEVKATWRSNPALFGAQSPPVRDNVPPPVPPNPPWIYPVNPDFPFDDIPAGVNTRFPSARIFDTWSRLNAQTVTPGDPSLPDYTQWASPTPTAGPDARIPLRIRILALKITIRAWDSQTQQARQITIIQDV